MNYRKLVVLVAAMLLTASAHAAFGDWVKRMFFGPAKDYGTWECLNCYIPVPGDPASTQAFPDIGSFIHYNNTEIHQDERISHTVPQSWITICNADNCLTVYYQADTDLWMPRTGSTPRGDRKVKVPKKAQVETQYRIIELTYEGPALTVDSITHIRVYDKTGVAPRDTSLAIRTGTVTAGPIEIVGKQSDFRKDTTDSLNKEIGVNLPENIGPSEGGTPPPPSDEPKVNTKDK